MSFTNTKPRTEQSTTRVVRANLQKQKLAIGWIRVVMLVMMLGMAAGLVEAQVVVTPEQVLPGGSAAVSTRPITAIRGSITDRNGVLLAVTVDAKVVVADQTLVTDPLGQAKLLAPLLDLDAAALAERLSGNSRYVVLARDVTPTTWSQIEALDQPGIYAEASQDRAYPEGELAANVLGYVDFYGEGGGGLEQSLNSLLAGKDGERSFTTVSGLTTADQQVTPAVDGKHVRLTIDRDIQWVAQQAIADRVKFAGAESGTVIVLNVRTGDILAMATAPTFNPNDLSTAKAKNLGNRALSDAYEPGSTGKVMTVATVIEEGVAGPDTKLTVPSKIKRWDDTFHDSEPHPTLNLTLTGVLAKSSNVGTVLASEKLPDLNNTLYRYFSKFGIGSKSGLEFPYENSGILPKVAKWSGTTAPTIAFGQGYSVNALQAASVFATLANNGVRMTPRLVAGFTDNQNRYTEAPPAAAQRVVSAETARTVREMMESVVSESGTAPMARIKGYRVAGKTGTAELADPTCGCYRGYVSSFIGLAPADSPELVVAVSLVKPKNGHYGGVLAGPVFKRVMSFALQQLRIAPTGADRPKMKLTW